MNAATTSLLNRFMKGITALHKARHPEIIGALKWNRFGVRDPTLLMSAEGHPVINRQGQFTLFFNARDRDITDSGITCVGRATGNPATGWTVDAQPVFVDRNYAAQGSVLQLAPDHHRLYYSADTKQGFAMASGSDDLIWKKFTGKPVLSAAAYGLERVGLPFVRRISDRWIMLFEGMTNGIFHIYLGVSDDGIHWGPANDGKPIYMPAADAWDGRGQANPSLRVERNDAGRDCFYILYSGCQVPGAWDIGILAASAIEGPWIPLKDPIMHRGGAGAWDGGGLKGARLFQSAAHSPIFMYFGLPSSDSYAGGGIAFAKIEPATESVPASNTVFRKNGTAEREFNDKLARRYFDVWDNYPIQQYSTKFESELIRKAISPRSKVILLGSGGGREVPAVLELGCSITAVDISPEMLSVGRRRYPNTNIIWLEADLHDIPTSLIDFDAAVCLGAVFNYLIDPALFLRNAKRCLRSGGSLIIAAINAQHASEPNERTVYPTGRVRQLYRLAALKDLLYEAGFEIACATGVRFLVDLLPPQWNQVPRNTTEESKILQQLLEIEVKLNTCLQAEQAKFILIHATAK